MSRKLVLLSVMLLCIGVGVQSRSVTDDEHQRGNETSGHGPAIEKDGVDGMAEGRQRCSVRGGCYRGYCWAGCRGFIDEYWEWCYTTKGGSQDYNYVRCGSDQECSRCWRCAGSCTL